MESYLRPTRTAIDAGFPVIPMHRMPEEGRRNPGSAVAKEYIDTIREHQLIHASSALGKDIGTLLAVTLIPGVNTVYVPAMLGIIGIHVARIGIDEARIMYHQRRYNKAQKKLQ